MSAFEMMCPLPDSIRFAPAGPESPRFPASCSISSTGKIRFPKLNPVHTRPGWAEWKPLGQKPKRLRARIGIESSASAVIQEQLLVARQAMA